MLEGATELGGFALAGELFFNGPMVIVANEDPVAVSVQGQRDAAARKQAAEQVEIAFGGLGGKEASGENFPSRIVLKAEGGQFRATAFEPVMGTAVKQDDFPLASRAQAALAMSGRASFAGRAETGGAQQSAQGFATEREAFLFGELLVEMVIVEPGIGACAPGLGCGAAPLRQCGGGWAARDWRVPAPLRRLADSEL